MLRRTFCQSILALFSLPLMGYTSEPEDEIVSASINTSFNLEPIFGGGELRIYEPVNSKPLIDISLEYKSGKIENYVADNKTWIRRRNKSILSSILEILHGPFITKRESSVKLDKKLMKLTLEVENCCCVITGLKQV